MDSVRKVLQLFERMVLPTVSNYSSNIATDAKFFVISVAHSPKTSIQADQREVFHQHNCRVGWIRGEVDHDVLNANCFNADACSTR